MKRCTKAANPPPCLSEYLAQNPDASWEQFRDTVDSCYHGVRAHLEKSSEGSWKPFFTLVRWILRSPAEDYLKQIGFLG